MIMIDNCETHYFQLDVSVVVKMSRCLWGSSVLKCRILALYVPLQATCSESVPTFFTTIDTSDRKYKNFAIAYYFDIEKLVTHSTKSVIIG